MIAWLKNKIKKKMKLKYFTLEEFDSPDVPGSGNFMKEDFLMALDKARDIAGIPFKINSGYRTMEHNATIGGVENTRFIGRCRNVMFYLRIMSDSSTELNRI